MAKNNIQDTSKIHTNTFVKGLNKDTDPTFINEGMWPHARNAVNNTLEGNIGTLSNETSNVFCAEAGNTFNGKKYILGNIHLYANKWVVFTVVYPLSGIGSPIGHEIGLFEEDTCKYRIIVQDPCLNFDKRYLITGASREQEDCSWGVYFADGLNPDRYLNIGDNALWPSDRYSWIGNNTYSDGINTIQWPGVKWDQDCNVINDCTICTDLTTLNCEQIRLARLMQTPTIKVESAVGGGSLRNGSYMATLAYSIKGQRVTDYFTPSNLQPLWRETDVQGSIDILISADSESFDEFELVVIQTINQGTVAKKIGTYSTKTSVVHLDQIKEDLIAVPIEQIPIRNVVYETSEQISEVNNYLLRVAPRSRFDFNYQPLANQIQAQWVSIEYPADYYTQGGSNTSYLRDEVYSFFIRWIYNTGDKTSSYHIPGRAPVTYKGKLETQPLSGDINTIDLNDRVFEVYNTATINGGSGTLPDGGIIKAQGSMGYWESTEKYPDNKNEVWNSSTHCWTGTNNPAYDLCGKPIRHHKFPDNITNNSNLTNHYANGGQSIRLMGVTFNNIILPKDNDGNDIQGIVGYEILRGSREGNRSIIAKGMLNNLRSYEIKGNNNQGRKGLYPNYPFNTIIPSSSSIGGHVAGYNDPYIRLDKDKAQTIPSNMLTFHSPDTNFRTPYLSATELKLYGSLSGRSIQFFQEPDQHPQFKMLADFVVTVAILAGVIEAAIQNGGKWTIQQNAPGPATGGSDLAGAAVVTARAASGAFQLAQELYDVALNEYFNLGGYFIDAFVPGLGPTLAAINTTYATATGIAVPLGGIGVLGNTYSKEIPKYKYAGPLGILNFLQQSIFYFAEGADRAIRLVYTFIPYRQYALQSIAEGFYSDFNSPDTTQIQRFNLEDSFYLKNNIQNVKSFSGINYVINNLKRQTAVTLRTSIGVNKTIGGPHFITGPTADKSLVTLGTAIKAGLPVDMESKKSNAFNLPIASHYGGIKYRLRNQYGQLDSVKQIPVTPYEQTLNKNNVNQVIEKNKFWCSIATPTGSKAIEITINAITQTPVFFGGDTYINRYTEKNNMFFFYDWLYGQPDGYENNYLLKSMIAEPRFWLNSYIYDVADLTPNSLADIISPPAGTGLLPTSYYNLDYYVNSDRKYNYAIDKPDNDPPNPDTYPGLFGVKNSYFYLANSSVRDFFVESDVLVDFREPGNEVWQQHYDHSTYTDLPAMFNMNPNTITRGNYYAYDYSLSISKVFTQYFSQGNLQSRYYKPDVSQLCYTYYPNRVVYSLPQQNASAKDSWFVYLVNNYKDFKDRITSIKTYAKTGMFITFPNASPLVYQGVDTLETDLGTKITIGDGGLFSNPPQNVTIADSEYEYGSSQNRYGVIATPAGMFYVSQNQGRIFSFDGGIKEISQAGMKWWFSLFLPAKLIKDFPDYPHIDNPVSGIGVQGIYDNYNSILYFCKKDYTLRKDLSPGTTVEYIESGNYFLVNNRSKVDLGDPLIFENASWTISYDPKSSYWISFHDWHPDLVLPAKQYFMTTKQGKLWKHNFVCDSYCNFYGVQHPFEVEIPFTTGQTVNTVKSTEYILECYKNVSNNCVDQYHVLDFNFDKAVLYNSEQVSGYLNLNLFPKNNITLAGTYPKINNNSIDILFSKEENKYRFNQFWDITKNRGEFPIGASYPPTGPLIPGTTILAGTHVEELIWNTQSNGYIKTLNSNNLDYTKPQMERKKMRHYLNFLYLSKADSKDINMIVKLGNSKNQNSLR
jgi:hypothetical protein